jgi:hypothetical protein
MTTRIARTALLALVVAPLLIISCSKKSDNGTGPGTGSEPPTVPAPQLQTTVNITSTNPEAVAAKALAESQLGLANVLAAYGTSFASQVNAADWGEKSGGCWSWSSSESGCSVSFDVCDASGGYTWTYTLNGNCGDTPYNRWVAFRVTTSADGLSGTVVLYEENSTTVMATWTWSVAADGKSGQWALYQGAESEANLRGTLTWTQNSDLSNDITWETAGSGKSKCVTHVAADGNSGTMKTYQWDNTASAYWQEYDIVWNSNGSGTWTEYNEDHNIVHTASWT